MLAVALFEEYLKRGYLQTVCGRTLGFWLRIPGHPDHGSGLKPITIPG